MYNSLIEYLSIEIDDAITHAQEVPKATVTLFFHEPVLVNLATRILKGMENEGDKNCSRIIVKLGTVH